MTEEWDDARKAEWILRNNWSPDRVEVSYFTKEVPGFGALYKAESNLPPWESDEPRLIRTFQGSN